MKSNVHTYTSVFNFRNQSCREQFLEFARGPDGLSVTSNYPGCLSLTLYQSDTHPNRMVIIQTWDSPNNKKKYLAMRQQQGTYRFLSTLVETPMELDLLTPVQLVSKL